MLGFGSNSASLEIKSDELEKLAWLIGNWHADHRGATVDLSFEWSDDLAHRFISCRATTRTEGARDTEELMLFGFDPIVRRVTDTRFDNGGGFRITIWAIREVAGQEGGLLLGHQSGYRGAGQHYMSHEKVEYIDGETFKWDSRCRKLDGEDEFPDPEYLVGVEFMRVSSQ
jgi:hypothetical protein